MKTTVVFEASFYVKPGDLYQPDTFSDVPEALGYEILTLSFAIAAKAEKIRWLAVHDACFS